MYVQLSTLKFGCACMYTTRVSVDLVDKQRVSFFCLHRPLSFFDTLCACVYTVVLHAVSGGTPHTSWYTREEQILRLDPPHVNKTKDACPVHRVQNATKISTPARHHKPRALVQANESVLTLSK